MDIPEDEANFDDTDKEDFCNMMNQKAYA